MNHLDKLEEQTDALIREQGKHINSIIKRLRELVVSEDKLEPVTIPNGNSPRVSSRLPRK